MRTLSKTYIVSTNFSERTIQARNKKEAIEVFKKQLGSYVSASDKITVR